MAPEAARPPISDVEQVLATPAVSPPAVGADTGNLQTAALRGSWWTAVQAMVSLPLTFAVNIVVARSLGPAGYGSLATYLAAFGLLLLVVNAGISDATIQWGASAHARGDRSELLELVRRCAGFHLFVETPVAAAAAAVLLRGQPLGVVLIGSVATAVTMAAGTVVVALTAMSYSSALARLGFGIGLVLNLAVVLAAVQTHAAGPTWVIRLAVAAAGPLLALLVAPGDVRAACLRPVPPWGWPPGFVAFSWRTVLVGLVGALVFSRSEIFVLAAFGQQLGVGVFALAAGLAGQLTAPVDAIAGPLVPAAASLVAVDRTRSAAAVLRGVRLSGVLTVPVVAVALPVIVAVLPWIYGPGFAAAAVPLLALGLVSGLQSVLHPVTAFVTACRRPLTVLAVNAVALAADLAATLILVPRLGVAGAVVGNCVGQVFAIGGSVLLLFRFLGVRPRLLLAAATPFGLSLPAGAAAALVAVGLDHAGWPAGAAAVVAAIGGAAAAGVLVGLRGAAVDDSDAAVLRLAFPRQSRPVLAALRTLRWLRPGAAA